jgi:hypothetical protein
MLQYPGLNVLEREKKGLPDSVHEKTPDNLTFRDIPLPCIIQKHQSHDMQERHKETQKLVQIKDD